MMAWWATNFYRIKHEHLHGIHWRTSASTALLPLLRKEVPLWFPAGEDPYASNNNLLFIGFDGQTYSTNNQNIGLDLSSSAQPYYFRRPPKVEYNTRETNLIRKIIRLQRDYNLPHGPTTKTAS